MSDPSPAEEHSDGCGEQPRIAAGASGSGHEASAPDGSGQGHEPGWTGDIDGLIGWAIARADAALDEICVYLADRPAIRGWQGAYPGESFPYLGRGRDQACSALRRRLRLQPGWAPRPMGTVRPPRLRRSSPRLRRSS